MSANANNWVAIGAARFNAARYRTVASIAQGVYGGCASVTTHTFHTQPQVSSMAMRKFLADKLLSLANAIEQDTSKEKLQAAVIVGRRKLADWIQPELPAAS